MTKPIFDCDGSELRVVKLPASQKFDLPKGYAVQDGTCDYYRTDSSLAAPHAWVRNAACATRFKRKADALKLARETAKGKWTSPEISYQSPLLRPGGQFIERTEP